MYFHEIIVNAGFYPSIIFLKLAKTPKETFENNLLVYQWPPSPKSKYGGHHHVMRVESRPGS